AVPSSTRQSATSSIDPSASEVANGPFWRGRLCRGRCAPILMAVTPATAARGEQVKRWVIVVSAFCGVTLADTGSKYAFSQAELLRALRSNDTASRQRAARDLGRLGWLAAPSVRALIEALDDR